MHSLLRPVRLLALFCFVLIGRNVHAAPGIWANSAQMDESGGTLACVVSVHDRDFPVTVSFRTVDGSARAGSDYAAKSGQLQFPPGVNSQLLEISFLNDAEVEGDEEFSIELFDASNGVPVLTPVVRIVIIDNELGYRFQSPLPILSCREDAPADFQIQRIGDFGHSSVEVHLEPSSAVPNIDYVPTVYTLNFAPGQTSATFRFEPINNAIENPFQRSLIASLRNPTAGVPGTAQRRIIISDNELGYRLHRESGWPASGMEGGAIKIIRDGDYAVESVATVSLEQTATPDRFLATPQLDFAPGPFTVRFAPFQRIAEVPLALLEDHLWEASERVFVRHTAMVSSADTRADELWIKDNEFNPLPTRALCPPFAPNHELQAFTTTPSGKILLAAVADGTTTVYQLLPDSTVDPEFQPTVITGASPALACLPHGGVLVAIRGPQKLVRLNRTGGIDPAFTSPITGDILELAPAPNGKIFILSWTLTPEGNGDWPHRLLRLNADGSLDRTLQTFPRGGGDLAPDDRGGLYFTGNFTEINGVPRGGFARLTEEGQLDLSFNPPPRRDLFRIQFLDGALYGERSYTVVRLLLSGEPDPTFNPFQLNSDLYSFLRDSQGRFYTADFRDVGEETRIVDIQRRDRDGFPDNSYVPGTFTLTGYAGVTPGQHGVLLSDDHLLLRGAGHYMGSMFSKCESLLPETGLGLVRLTQPSGATVKPGSNSFPENAGTVEIPIWRIGDNQGAADIPYLVRNGSALRGEHFNMQPSGSISFASATSVATLQLQIHDNAEPGPGVSFYIDFKNAQGETLSTSEISIYNDERSIRWNRQIDDQTWEILATGGPWLPTPITSSPDLIDWRIDRFFIPDVPIRIRIDQPQTFFFW